MRANGIGSLMVVCGAVFAGTGCATTAATREEGPAATAPETKGEDPAAERRSLEAEIAVAERRLDHARMEREMHEAEVAFSIEMAEQEVRIAEAALEHFLALESPNRTAESELELERARDAAAEAAEELAQIELMYKEQDLEDMTAEFVINRGKRNAEWARHSLEIQAREHEALKSHELPRERQRLEMDVRRKRHDLEQGKIGARATRLMKEIAVMNAEAELGDLRRKLEKLEAGGES